MLSIVRTASACGSRMAASSGARGTRCGIRNPTSRCSRSTRKSLPRRPPGGFQAKPRSANSRLPSVSPFKLDYTVTIGHVSAKGPRPTIIIGPNAERLDQDYLQTDALINPGNSGRPVAEPGRRGHRHQHHDPRPATAASASPSRVIWRGEISDKLVADGKISPALGSVSRFRRFATIPQKARRHRQGPSMTAVVVVGANRSRRPGIKIRSGGKVTSSPLVDWQRAVNTTHDPYAPQDSGGKDLAKGRWDV